VIRSIAKYGLRREFLVNDAGIKDGLLDFLLRLLRDAERDDMSKGVIFETDNPNIIFNSSTYMKIK
jgi:hypothetical protein